MREHVLGRGNSLCEGEKLSPAASLERENNWVLIREEPRQGAPVWKGLECHVKDSGRFQETD